MTSMDRQALKQALASRARLSLVPGRGPLSGFRESAVLVPLLIDGELPPRLLYTVRRLELPTHPGQISFPGGKRDPSDSDAWATALREAEEELGLRRDQLDPVGMLDDVPTPSGFVITPVVALLGAETELKPSKREVASAFTCSIEALRSPGCYVVEGRRSFAGVDYDMHAYLWGEHRIWGATARITHQLLGLLDR